MEIEINPLFQKALDISEKEGKNLFITGRAGTGKSTFLSYFCQKTKKKFVLLAPTGVAAVNISGQTIHSFFKFKPGVTLEEAKTLGKRLRKSKIYQETKLLIIDEISMVRADLLDCVDVFLKTARKKPSPFGGAQVLFIGDLYQLPPVVKGEERQTIARLYQTPYFFSANVIKELSLEFIEFEKNYRQTEEDFINLLNSIRNKTIDENLLQKLNSRHQKSAKIENLRDYICLTARNKQAEEINWQNLSSLPGKPYCFEAEIEGEIKEELYPADFKLYLKKGARVMFLNNDSRRRWINGSLGWVVSVSREKIRVLLDDYGEVEVYPHVWEVFEFYFDEKKKTVEKMIVGGFSQFPLKLSWASTIHKSQGKTFDKVIIDIGAGTFAHGQVYVALSRCRSFKGIVLKQPIELKHIWLDRRVVYFLTKFQYQLAEKELSTEERTKMIEEAIAKKQKMEIVYLKNKDEKSKRIILPRRLYETEYNGYPFTALEGFCFWRKEERIFNLKRILAMRIV